MITSAYAIVPPVKKGITLRYCVMEKSNSREGISRVLYVPCLIRVRISCRNETKKV
jgi:hypothetical protein